MRDYGRSVIPALIMLFAFTACGKSKGKTEQQDTPKGADAKANVNDSGSGTSAQGVVQTSGTSTKTNGAVALTGCNGAAALTGFSIVGGEDVCPDALVGKSTVILYDGNGMQLCTATRIGPNQLITAAHCLEGGVVNMQIGYLGAPQAQVSSKNTSGDDGSDDSGDDSNDDSSSKIKSDKSTSKSYDYARNGFYGNGYYRTYHDGYKLTLRSRQATSKYNDTQDDSQDDASNDSGSGADASTPAFAINPASIPGVDPSLKIIATVFHPRFDILINGKANDYQDIGMVVFSGSMPVAITPIAGFADFATTTPALATAADKTLVKAGFGTRGDTDTSDSDNLQSVVLNVASLDQPNAELAYQYGTKKGTCYGDSGGPGYLKSGNALKLIGITSRGPEITDAQGKVTESGCDAGNGIDTDARYYRGWISCVAKRISTQFPTAGLTAPLLTLEAQDTSANFCNQTVIKSPAQLAAESKTACLATAGMAYDDANGDCTPTTAAACKTTGGTWDAQAKSCDSGE